MGRILLAFYCMVVPMVAMGGDKPVPNYDESKIPPYTLPDVLTDSKGKKITTAKEWQEYRRAEVLELFKVHMFGRSPGRPEKLSFKTVSENKGALDGTATAREVDVVIEKDGKNVTIRVNLIVPNKREKPAPAFLLINNRSADNIDITRVKKSPFWPAEEIVARGYAAVAFHNEDVALDKDTGFKDGIFNLLDGGKPRGPDSWAVLSAWAWGASRVMDYLEIDADIDAKHVAVIGHSRGGKTALWTGAQDERFALTISNDSGCGGAALSRRWYGETVAAINLNFPFWFCENFKKYDDHESDLPLDQHMLLALMAPRAVYVASAEDDKWADPKGEYLGLYYSSPIYELFGLKGLPSDQPPPIEKPVYGDVMGYHIRPGKHDLTLYDWQRYMDFADRLWKQK